MNPLLTIVAEMAILTWVLLLAASLLRAKAWTFAGLQVAFGNREGLPSETGLAGRAERTARNTLENFILFAAVALTAQAAGATDGRVLQGAQIFLWARLIYVAVYYAGIPYVRTAVWFAGVGGVGLMLSALL